MINVISEGNIIAKGSAISEERELNEFDSIALGGVADVNIHPGEEQKVIVTTPSNVQKEVITKVKGNTLYIEKGNKSVSLTRQNNMTVDVYMPELKNLRLTGAGDVKIESGNSSQIEIILDGTGDINAENYQVENVNITQSGAGDAKIWVTETLKANLSGTGDIYAYEHPMKNANITQSGAGNGKIWITETLTLDNSGTGDIYAYEHPMKNANITQSGAGDIRIWVTEILEANLSGTGDISYKGNPTVPELNIDGAGTINHIS